MYMNWRLFIRLYIKINSQGVRYFVVVPVVLVGPVAYLRKVPTLNAVTRSLRLNCKQTPRTDVTFELMAYLLASSCHCFLKTYTICSHLQIKKPIIERRRRDRINESLNQLKTLVLDALNKDVSIQLLLICFIRLSLSVDSVVLTS